MTEAEQDLVHEGRERGTPSKTLPRRPKVIFGIALVVATCATMLCCRSQLSSNKWPALLVGASMSSLSVITGIAYMDSAIHSLFLGLAVFATVVVDGMATGKQPVELLSQSFSLARALFLIFGMSKIPAMRSLFHHFDTGMILNPIIIGAICSLPVVTVFSGYALLVLAQKEVEFSITANASVAIATHILSLLYYLNRANKHGNLMIQSEQRGMSVATALAFAWTIQFAIRSNLATVFLPILVGSCITSLLAVVFASVADVWEAIGSGQFQMVSLDTAVLLAYVLAPLLVLANLAYNKYGEIVSQSLDAWIRKGFAGGFLSDTEQPPERALTSGLFLLLGLATMTGVSLVNMLSPVGAYLMAKAYTHGQHRTRRIALCVLVQDLLIGADSKEANEEVMECLTSSLAARQPKPIVNFFVTAQELRVHSELIGKLKSAGHCVGLCSTTADGIIDAVLAYKQLLKCDPQWFHVGSNGITPHALMTASDLDLKVGFWSTHIAVTSRDILLNVDLPNLCLDVEETVGGNIVYLTNDWNDANAMVSAVTAIVEQVSTKFDNKYSFAALSNVAKDDAAMAL